MQDGRTHVGAHFILTSGHSDVFVEYPQYYHTRGTLLMVSDVFMRTTTLGLYVDWCLSETIYSRSMILKLWYVYYMCFWQQLPTNNHF